MKLKFKEQDFQTLAVNTVVDLFAGQKHTHGAFSVGKSSQTNLFGDPPEDVALMADYAPARVIISSESFADNTDMANAYYILRDKGIGLKLI